MKILLAVDDSSHSQDVVAEVLARPWPSDSSIRVLTAIADYPPTAVEFVLAGETAGTIQDERVETAKELTSRIAESLKRTGLTIDTVVRHADARAAIVDEAKEWGADLIVMGSHGHTGVKRWLIGSVAQSVVAHAPCSVEVVRRPASTADRPA
ncbi:MAG: universal stress protein [Acidobacteria bacterium]|nr:universal stress protein [Acidobacteriota bacterium]